MEAPHVAIITGSLDKSWVRNADGYNSLETDLAIAMDHLVLGAWALGVGTCWIANFEAEVLQANLGLGPEERVYAMTPLGWPSKDANFLKIEKERKPLEQLLLEL
jgi:nitroreductase